MLWVLTAMALSLAPSPARVDLHAHVTMRRAAAPIFAGEPGKSARAHASWNFWSNQLDAPSLREAKIAVVVVALWPPFRLRPGRSELEEALHQLRALEDFAREQPDFVVARSSEEIERAVSLGRIALFPSIEGGEGIQRVEDVDALYAAGARALTLVHFSDNTLAGAMRMPNARVVGIPPDTTDQRPLSALGAAVVERMIALGMVIDLAHASEAAAHDVLSVAEARGVPTLVSHTNPWALAPFEPNISDALAARVARGGGLLGLLTQIVWIGELPEAARLNGHVLGTCDDTIALWRHLAKVAGEDQVMLGSDLNGFIVRPGPGGRCPQGLAHAEGWPAFFKALKAELEHPESVDRSLEAFLRLLRRVEAAADPAARSRALGSPRVPPAPLFDVPTF